MVKTDKSWKKVCFSQWNIWLSDRLLLEWYNKTTKKHWNNDVVGSTAKKGHFFDVFFRNHENSQAKNPVNGKQQFLKKNLFWRCFEKSDRTNFFFGNGLIEPKNWWKAPYRIVDIPYKTQKRHFSTETVIFGQKKAPAASRQPRKMVLFLEKRYLGQKKAPAASRQPKKVQNAHFFCRKNGKKHQNLHEMVIYPTFCDDS